MTITLSPSDYFILILLGLFVLAVILYFTVKRLKKPDIDTTSLDKIKTHWQEIEKLVNSDSSMSWKMAVLEADKIFDYALKSLAMPGKDLGERLRAMSYKQPNIKDVWPAHQVRNRLVHESDYHLDKKTAIFSIRRFERALKILRVL